MTLRKKAILIICVTLGGLIAALYAVSRLVLLHSFAELERQDTERNVARVLNALNDDVTTIDRECRNAATWDKAYAFIQDGNRGFVQSEVGEGALSDPATRHLNLEVFARSTGEVVFGEGFDLAAQRETPIPAGLARNIRAGSPFLGTSGVSGIVVLPEGPMLLAARPILTTAGKGPIYGSVMMGRYLNDPEIRRLGARTHLAVTITKADRSPLTPSLVGASQSAGRPAILVRAASRLTITGYTIIKDIDGTPALILGVSTPREIYQWGRTSVLYLLLSLVVVGIVFGAVTLILLEKAILTRLSRLGREVTRVGESSDLAARIPVGGTDELGKLASDINRMLEGLEHSQQEIHRRQQAQEEALAAQKNAEKASRAKSAFLANMSHELRTPLNAIIGYSEMLREDAEMNRDESQATDLARITGAGKHLLTLINEVLDLSKVEAGKTEIVWEEALPAKILDDSMDTMRELARSSGNRLMVHCGSELPTIRVDVMKFRQCLYNLLSNACKFTKNGLIRLEVVLVNENGAESIEWRVSDTGIGIPPEQMHKLFQPFSQVDASMTRQFGGTGLGLAISQRFCLLMGGTIQVSSEQGKGSTFTIRLPLLSYEMPVHKPVRSIDSSYLEDSVAV